MHVPYGMESITHAGVQSLVDFALLPPGEDAALMSRAIQTTSMVASAGMEGSAPEVLKVLHPLVERHLQPQTVALHRLCHTERIPVSNFTSTNPVQGN